MWTPTTTNTNTTTIPDPTPPPTIDALRRMRPIAQPRAAVLQLQKLGLPR